MLIKAEEIKIGMKMNLPWYGDTLKPATVINVFIVEELVVVEYRMDKSVDGTSKTICRCNMKKDSEYNWNP